MDILTYILRSLYFFLPAYFVNMAPPLARRAAVFNFLYKPVDFGKKFFGQPLLGSHKTWLGVIFGILAGILITLFQLWLYQFSFIQKISLINYQKISPVSNFGVGVNILVFGFLISAGAVFGDLLSAFIKRRLKIAPGAKFIPFDQTNYVIGAAIFLTPYLKIDIRVWITIFILTFFLHIISNRLGYLLKVHQAKW